MWSVGDTTSLSIKCSWAKLVNFYIYVVPKHCDYFSILVYSLLTISLISTSGEPSVNRIDLLALTLAGPIWLKPALDPLAVHHPENQLYMLICDWITQDGAKHYYFLTIIQWMDWSIFKDGGKKLLIPKWICPWLIKHIFHSWRKYAFDVMFCPRSDGK